MKSLYSFWALMLLPLGVSLAQTRPTSTTVTKSTVKPPTTRPAATDGPTSSPSTPNRQQELYDQYHGITKKPATPAPAATTTTTPVPSRPADESMPNEVGMRVQPSALDGSDARVRIGVRGGVTYLVYTEKATGVDPAIGFVGGLTFNFGTGTLSFQPELNYARYSTKVSVSGLGSQIRAADVIEVPLLLKISSGMYSGSRFFVNVGPYGTYGVSKSVNGKQESLDGVKGRFGFGAAAGVGAALKAGPGHFTIELRGMYALGDTENGFSTDSKTIFTQAAVGYLFPLGGQ